MTGNLNPGIFSAIWPSVLGFLSPKRLESGIGPIPTLSKTIQITLFMMVIPSLPQSDFRIIINSFFFVFPEDFIVESFFDFAPSNSFFPPSFFESKVKSNGTDFRFGSLIEYSIH